MELTISIEKASISQAHFLLRNKEQLTDLTSCIYSICDLSNPSSNDIKSNVVFLNNIHWQMDGDLETLCLSLRLSTISVIMNTFYSTCF